MVKRKIKLVKSFHDKKIDLLKEYKPKINGFTINQHEKSLKEIEGLIKSQIKVLDLLESDFTFQDEFQDEFESAFQDSIELVKDQIQEELILFKKITNPYYDGSLRFENFEKFLKLYEKDLNKKKSFLESLKSSFFKQKSVEDLQNKAKELEEGNKEDTKKEAKDSIPEYNAVENAKAEVERVTKEQNEEKVEEIEPKVTREELISKLQDKPEITDEYEIKTKIENNNIKLNVQVKIVNNIENSAWAYVFQKYHSVDNKTSKSGQIKGFEKLKDLRRESLDRMLGEIQDKVANLKDYKEVEQGVLNALNNDGIEIY